ncbi:chromosome partitioning protein ParB [Dehalobacter sp. MCB1]|uniref:ParB/RepB/Spo0J family partition protein n=1 Tax=unclassified Dehalobacter TaxID=2635733 RepID=UPI000E6C581B|nr:MULTISPECIES: ParB/RepB/Spo0J family partition protein [unclassified Dehalobacter]RJE47939.1 chromosome partitioning protein ParB [Dehalobacter sp. MCB1]TCX56717.1 chromosome partitioning protein ParB [Dehalobacter sp. 12DCB1]
MRSSIKLTSVDELFTTEENRADSQREKVLDISLSEISDFPSHPFKVKADEAMLEMADSVTQYGVLVPGLVRPKPDGGYEMVAGHRRKKASELAGKKTMPCIVRELDDDEATIIMVDSNLQRESILPSEKAFAYRMKLEAMKRQGQRTDLTSRPVVEKSVSADILGENTGESGRQIQRYIRLTELIPSILQMVDDNQVAFRPAVELSYLSENEQQDLYNTIQSEDCTPSLSQAQRLKKFSQDGRLNIDVIYSILSEEKPNQKERFHIQRDRIDRYFPKNFTEKQKEELVVQLLESWFKKRHREQQER